MLRDCGTPDYKQKLDAQLDAMGGSEMWRTGAVCRSLRPHEKARTSKVGTAGRKTN